MNIFSFISLFGGLALFIYGMNVMSQGLERLAGGKLEGILKKMTSNPVKSLFLGLSITAVIQSSSAVTVMLVGLVNSGIMELGQTVGVIMGSNIGTTVTAWILSSIGIEGDNVWVKLLNPSSFSPILAFIGMVMIMASSKRKHKDIGTILIGFAVLMYGMNFMSGAVKPLANSPSFAKILVAFENPILGIATGLVLTAIIQSSSASVGILQALSLTSSVTYGMAIPIIMGQNIGTCATALISSIGVSKNAKRVAIIHIAFNLIGTIVCLVLFYGIDALIHFPWMADAISPVGVAVAHSLFNIITTVLLLPFSKQLVKIAEGTIKVEDDRKFAFLDERLLKTPSIALQECKIMTSEMAKLSSETVVAAMDLLFNYKEQSANRVSKLEKDVDTYEDKLGSYLVKLSSYDLSEDDNRGISTLLHTIGDFERISDHAINIMNAAEEIHDKKVTFSPEAMKEISYIERALKGILELTLDAFITGDIEKAKRVEPLEEVIDDITETIKLNHIARLRNGSCTIEYGFILNDLLISYERISDHCSNIAVAMIEVANYSFETHKYLKKLKTHNDEFFRDQYQLFSEEYGLKSE
ncbi:phosphate:Na+ symporter [Peptostreptococcaceae bacterium pGA-8]|nr:phosphate:Na+ symporter [Peptostreptococcaceae bacterium pGA-8]